MLRVYNHSAGQDAAGIAYRTKVAFDRHYQGQVRYRSLAVTPTYLDYPTDMILGPITALRAGDLYRQADVVHLNSTLEGLWAIGINRRKVPKPTLLQHHGTRFRDGHREIAAEARDQGCLQAVSTLDLMLEPDLTWVPAPYDLAALAALRLAWRQEVPGDPREIVISHCPTQRGYKNTEAFVAAVDRLVEKGRRVRLDLVEGVTWQQCLGRKARSDIHLDQMTYGYGCNAVEAWGMGIPVVAGVDESLVPGTRERMLDTFGGSLPFAEASEATIVDVLDRLVSDAAQRDAVARAGVDHAWRFHDERQVAALLFRLYSGLAGL